MSDVGSQVLKRTIIASAAAATAFAALAAVPAVLSAGPAAAREIAIAPPNGAPMSFADLVQRVSPAVVSIQVKSRAGGADSPDVPPEVQEFFRRFGQEPPQPREATSLGSGFFIDPRGTVVTNHHVVEGATEITVRLNDEKEYKAELVGSDQLTDVAVLRLISPGRANFPFVQFDKQADLRVGDWVVAVGNPFGLEGTATAGIVSAIGRRNIGGSNFVDFIQTDAPINRGNSGGPTFDLQGRVVGVNSAIFSPTGGNVGIGFAIPAATADTVVRQLIAGGRVSRGWLGVQVQPMDDDLAKSFGLDEPKGALVASVIAGGPAAGAGLRAGDLILAVNGQDVKDQSDLTRKVASAPVNSNARFDILREGQRRTLSVRLGERPGEQQLASADPSSRGETAPSATPDVRQAALGVDVRPVRPEERRRLDLGDGDTGLVVTRIESGSELAEKAVARGDVLLQASGRPLRTAADLEAAVAASREQRRPLQLLVRGQQGPSRFVAVDVTAKS